MTLLYHGRQYREAAPTEYLYHVTLVRNLDSIAEQGLLPGVSQNSRH